MLENFAIKFPTESSDKLLINKSQSSLKDMEKWMKFLMKFACSQLQERLEAPFTTFFMYK